MNKIILLGHASSGLHEVEALLLSSGMQSALPSKRDNLMPADVVHTLCQAHQCAQVNEATTEEDFAPVKAGAIWSGLAMDLMLGNLQQPLWGWADTRNIYWLDYWAELDPHATFVMVYDHPHKALQVMSAQLVDKPLEMQIARLLENWQAYNGAMLSFYSRHATRCLLVNAGCAREQLQAYLGQLGTQLHGKAPKLCGEAFVALETKGKAPLPMQANLALAISEAPEIAAVSITAWFGGATDLDQHLLQQLLHDHPVALQVFAELEAASTVPNVHVDSANVHPGAAWLQLIQQRQATADLVMALYEKLQIQLSQLQVQQSQITKLASELDKSKRLAANAQTQVQALPAPKLQELEEENDLLLTQLHQVQEELERYYLENQALKKTQVKPTARLYGAADRIQQQLTYRLGTTFIANSRSLGGWLRMPFALRREVNAYRVDMSKKGNKNLPPIHTYADAYEAERYKQHLSYKLGQALLRHTQTPWGWFVLPFALISTANDFKKARS
jgi:hypothetical protein